MPSGMGNGAEPEDGAKRETNAAEEESAHHA